MKTVLFVFSLSIGCLLTSCDQTGPGCYKYDITYKGKKTIDYQYWDETEQHDLFVWRLQSEGRTVISSKVNKNRTECALANVNL